VSNWDKGIYLIRFVKNEKSSIRHLVVR
jgi:hypothetical protein